MDLTPSTGPLGRLVEAARAEGRAAGPWGFHSDVLLDLLGRPGEERATASAEHREGRVAVVPGARAADVLVVPDGPDAVAEVDLHHASVTVVERPSLVDPTTCHVEFGRDAVLAIRPVDVPDALARAAIVLAADAVGAAEAALEAALAHVRTREQFGAPLGTLPVVQHRAVDMAIDVRLATDAVLDAAGVADRGEPPDELQLVAAHAKAGVVRCQRVTAAAHQLAGGQGILAAAPFHRWHRRVIAAELLLGDTRHHRAVVGRAAIAGRNRFG